MAFTCLSTRLFWLSAAVAFGLLLATTAQAAPLACTLMGGPKAQVVRDGQMRYLPIRYDDCVGATISVGPVRACVQDRFGNLRCQQIDTGKTIVASTFGSGTAWSAMRRSIGDLFGDGSNLEIASSRGDDAGLPFGQVLLLVPRLVIDFSQPSLSEIRAIEFREDNPSGPLVVVLPGGALRQLETSLFQPGRSYSWTLLPKVGSTPSYGRFRVADAEARRTTVARARRAVAGKPDAAARAMLQAESYDLDGYGFDAAQQLKLEF